MDSSHLNRHRRALHRIRTELVRQRTAKVNQIRGLLGEYGIVARQGDAVLRKALPDILEDAENGLMSDFRALLAGLREDLVYLDERVVTVDQTMQTLANSHASARRLLKLRGVGPITATALVASLGDGHLFQRGRDASGGAGAGPAQQRRQRQAVGHQQARGRLSAHAPGSRCKISDPGGQGPGRVRP